MSGVQELWIGQYDPTDLLGACRQLLAHSWGYRYQLVDLISQRDDTTM